jgi:hypothetical protein
MDHAYGLAQSLLQELEEVSKNAPKLLLHAYNVFNGMEAAWPSGKDAKMLATLMHEISYSIFKAEVYALDTIKGAIIDAHKAGKNLQVYVATVSCDSGDTHFAHLNIQELDKALETYCLENWAAVNAAYNSLTVPPDSGEEVIVSFFTVALDFTLTRGCVEVLP